MIGLLAGTKISKTTVVTIVVLILIGLTGGYIWYLNSTIETKQIEIDALKLKNGVLQISNDSLVLSIEYQNEENEKFRADADKVALELEEWRNKPPEVKYKTEYITKIVKDTKVVYKTKEAECDAIMDRLNDIKELRLEDF